MDPVSIFVGIFVGSVVGVAIAWRVSVLAWRRGHRDGVASGEKSAAVVQEQLAASRKELTLAQSQVHADAGTISTLRERLEATQVRATTAEAEAKGSNEARAEIHAEIVQRRQEVERAHAALEEAKREASAVRAEAARLTEISQQVDQARGHASTAEVARRSAEEQLHLAERAKTEAVTAHNAAIEKQQELTNRLFTTESELAESRRRNETLAAERAKLLEAAEASALRYSDLDQRAAAATKETAQLRGDLTAARADVTRLSVELDGEKRAARERALENERAREAMRMEFKNLAQQLLDEKGKVLLDEHKVGLDAALAPFRERLKEFEATFTNTYKEDSRDRTSLLAMLKRLDENEARLTKEAENLSRALSGDNKLQGDWGEMILEKVLQAAGLEKGREYELQEHHTTEEGDRLRPDAIVYLPDDKAIVIDSKVAIADFLSATTAKSEEERSAALAAHAAAIRNHVKGLHDKQYNDVIGERTLDFVIAFVPNEPAFHAAITSDRDLYGDAFRKGIVLLSPTTLLVTLRVVAHVWLNEKQNANAQRIAQEAGRMLDKLTGFVAELEEVGDRLRQAQRAYDGAHAKLSTGKGNVIGKAKKVLKLGAKGGDKAQQLLSMDADDEDDDVELPTRKRAIEIEAQVGSIVPDLRKTIDEGTAS